MGIAALLVLSFIFSPANETTPFDDAVQRAERALQEGDHDEARLMIDRASERDPNSRLVWALRARWAEAVEDKDELVYALHQQYRLARSQKARKKELDAIRASLEAVDPIAPDLLDLKYVFVEKLLPIAKSYEKEKRPHSAIRIHNEVLTLDPDRIESDEAIQRIASQPDPSLAESARPKDLFADVSDEWIKEFDEEHNTWKTKAKHDGENYVTLTDAGYRVMMLAAEAMEQVNAFYRVFFDYGVEGGKVPKIELRIFKNRDEYLKMGSNPPEWSGGLFTGSAVETFLGSGGFDEMIRTLFHEVGHQFVGLAAPGARSTTWLNEGMATYFEGCRVLNNGTVKMNMPANHYLFGLTGRMERGWMNDRDDGIDPKDPTTTPEKAPTLETVIENKYRWGPPWYAPVWGVTYFFFNYQDPVDGRFLYRKMFREYTNQSGGRVGEGAVRKLEEFVLGNPNKPTKSVDWSEVTEPVELVSTVRELNETWKEWLIRLRDEESGRVEVERPYHQWALYAVEREEKDVALEYFEKALMETPEDVTLLIDFARFLAEHLKNSDRASKLVRHAIQILEFQEEVDEVQLKKADALLARWDSKVKALQRIHEQLWAAAKSLAQRYLDADLPMMAMDVSWRFGTELGVPDILPYFEEGVRRSGKSLWIWKLAYNERDLEGWITTGDQAFSAKGPVLESHLGVYEPDNFDYQFLTMDTVSSGDFSMEAEIYAESGKISFCGLVFGKKGERSCNAVILFPGGSDPHRTGTMTRSGSLDLTSFYGPGAFKIWRHNAVKGDFPDWHTVRVDVAGKMVDVWFDGKLVTTHEFPNMGILRGSFGLITGKGTARFRNIRYLARPARDPGARIEREIKMEKLRGKVEAAGEIAGGVDGSWLGFVPPFPQYVRWVQNPIQKWSPNGPAPTVVNLWSIKQNDLIPVDGWLAFLAEKYKNVGLQIVTIASAEDEKNIKGYLGDHSIPGSICTDRFRRKGYGHMFERYGVEKFGMPRILLLDLDNRVVWEGDPGFRIGIPWNEGIESYLDGPLEDLVVRRKLRKLSQWREEWNGRGKKALHEGNLALAAKLLLDARSFDGELDPEVKEAQRRLERLNTTLDGIEAMILTLSRTECEPALNTLVAWSRLMDKNLDPKTLKEVKSTLKGRIGLAWKKSMDQVERCKKSLKPDKEFTALESLLEKLEPLEGTFPETLRAELTAATDAGDLEEALKILEDVESIPARWLAREYFKW